MYFWIQTQSITPRTNNISKSNNSIITEQTKQLLSNLKSKDYAQFSKSMVNTNLYLSDKTDIDNVLDWVSTIFEQTSGENWAQTIADVTTVDERSEVLINLPTEFIDKTTSEENRFQKIRFDYVLLADEWKLKSIALGGSSFHNPPEATLIATTSEKPQIFELPNKVELTLAKTTLSSIEDDILYSVTPPIGGFIVAIWDEEKSNFHPFKKFRSDTGKDSLNEVLDLSEYTANIGEIVVFPEVITVLFDQQQADFTSEVNPWFKISFSIQD